MSKKFYKEPADSIARNAALEISKSVILQAPAGSGKTELLIQRYMKLLTLVEYPEEVIAITFTRKAAAEMRERVLNAMNEARQNIKRNDEYHAISSSFAQQVLKKNIELKWGLESNPARLRILTIDSLCTNFTRQMPLLSRLGAQPRIVEDAGQLYERAAENAINTAFSEDYFTPSLMELFLHLDNNLPRLRTLLVEMLAKRDQWSRFLYGGISKEQMQSTITVIIESKLEEVHTMIPDDMGNRLCELITFAEEELGKSEYENYLESCKALDMLPGITKTDLQQWYAVADFLLTKTGTWRKKVDKRNGFPSDEKSGPKSARQKENKHAVIELIQQFEEISDFDKILHRIRLLPDTIVADADWQIIQTLGLLLKLSAAQLNILFSENGEIDFNGMSEAAIQSLGSADEPTDLALYLDYQIKHVLIDEFQDISVNQYVLIEKIISGWSKGDGRTIFLVGDPMQSIYRFREAEVGQFLSTFHRKSIAGVEVDTQTLTVNFRSQSGIVDWINDSFSRVFPLVDDITTGAVHYTEAIADASEGNGEVNVLAFPDGNSAKEIQYIVDTIRKLKKNNGCESIALLVRNRSHLDEIIPALKAAQLSYQAIDIDLLVDQQHIQDITAITRAYLKPSDRVAWLAILRAPWCGLLLDDMYQICELSDKHTIYENCQAALEQGILPETSAQRLGNLVAVFNEAFAERTRLSLRNTIETIWCKLGGPATLRSQADLDNIEVYLKLLNEVAIASEYDEVEYVQQKLNKLYALPDSDSDTDLQIMTIHKAKGLEFDHVIIPRLGKKQKPRQPELLSWMLTPQYRETNELLLAPIYETGQKPGKLQVYLGDIQKSRAENEELRLLYVASTRARKSLHLYGELAETRSGEKEPVPKPKPGSLFSSLWPAISDTKLTIITDSEVTSEKQTVTEDADLFRLRDDWICPDPAVKANISSAILEKSDVNLELEIEFDWAGELIKKIGIVVHQLLAALGHSIDMQNIESSLESNSGLIRSSLLQAGVTTGQITDATSKVKESLKNICTDDVGRWILSNEHTLIRNEYALSGIIDGKLFNVILDRTFVDEKGTRWIIDYKINRHEGVDVAAFLDQEVDRYRNKMNLYASLFSGMETNQIMLGLYFPLLKGWRTWEYSND